MMMSNKRKAAVLLEGMGEPYTTNILNMLDEKTSIVVLQEMAAMDRETTKSEISEVVSEVISIKSNINTYGKKGHITTKI